MIVRIKIPMIHPFRTSGKIFEHLLSNCHILAIFALFVVVRTFSHFEYVTLGGDTCNYLSIARSFPWHRLYNMELYLVHPPPFGYAIACFNIFLPLFASGLIVALLFAILSFWAIWRYSSNCGLNCFGVSFALLYLGLNGTLAGFDSHVSRVSMLFFLTAMSLLCFEEYLKQGSRNLLLRVCIFNSLALLSSDQALSILPAQFVLVLSSWNRLKIKEICAVFTISLISYSIWPLVRLYIYLSNDFYPAGIDGTIEILKPISIKSVIQPNFLPFTNMHRSCFTSTEMNLKSLDIIGALGKLPADILFLPRILSAWLVSILAALSLLRSAIKKDSRILALWIISVILYLPCFFGMNVWCGMGMAIPFSMILGKGAEQLFEIFKFNEKCFKHLIIVISAFLSLVWILGLGGDGANTPLRPVGGINFIFCRKTLTRVEGAVKYFPPQKDGECWMAPVTFTPEMLYLRDGKWIALPFDVELLEPIISEYKVAYIVLTDEFMLKSDNPMLKRAAHLDVVSHILSHPERFSKVGEWIEMYPDCYASRKIYLFKIMPAEKRQDR